MFKHQNKELEKAKLTFYKKVNFLSRNNLIQ